MSGPSLRFWGLSPVRKIPARLLNKTATIARPTRTETATGWVKSTMTVASAVPCRVSPLTTDEDRAVAASLQAEVTNAIYFLPEVDVRRDDQVTVDGLAYKVELAHPPSIAAYLKAYTTEVQRGA